MDYLALFIGLVLGVVLGVFIGIKRRVNQQDDDRSYHLLQEEKQRLSQQLEHTNSQLQEFIAKHASEEQRSKELEKDLQEQKGQLEDISKKFNTEFENLANKILEQKSEKFTQKNKENLESILGPLKENILEFEKRLVDSNLKQHGRHEALKTELENLGKLNKQMSEDAQNLVKALKGDSKAQGDWGEMVLERILEGSGLTKDREYTLQVSGVNEEGRRLQPDAVVLLPDKKKVVVDAKVSLVHYERFTSSQEDDQVHLKQFIGSVRNHIKLLSEKHYSALYRDKSLDFVLMFLPVEPAFLLALQRGDNLYQEAYDKGIVLVSPTTLLATLRTIANIWKHEYQNRNVLEIADEAGKLYDKFTALVEDLLKVGKQLDTTKGSYEAAMNKLSTGTGNLVTRVEKIKKLGAKTKKSLPQAIVERSKSSPTELLKE